MLYAEVIVPLHLPGVFTYSVPTQLSHSIKTGSRVIVQFGKKKFYTAIVYKLTESVEFESGLKEIVSLLDESPIALPMQISFWEWIASYYMCTIGEVYKAAIPSALKLESETLVFRNAEFESQVSFSSNESRIFLALPDNKPLKISEIEKLTGIHNIAPYIKSLADRNAVSINESVKNRYTPKTETNVSLSKEYTEEELNSLLSGLQRAKKQQTLLADFLRIKETDFGDNNFISKKELLLRIGQSSAILDALVARQIFKYSEMEVSRFDYGESAPDAAKTLNPFQQEAYCSIKKSFSGHTTTLLHGVTSSGKTEIYIQLIKDAIESGKQVLYLLPEIALTTQITERLKRVFGNKLTVYHSKFNDNERADVWKNLLNDEPPQVILGVRSSVFLPFKNLGLIIVDEEHESSYKQQEPAPRYNARDAAIYLAHLHDTKILLGTATPAIESYYNAKTGKYGLVVLSKRYDDIALPQIEVVNTKELRRKKQMKSVLSPILSDKITSALSKKEQVILFQNRRGFAPLLECKTCAWTPKCNHCDVSLTYHKGQNILLCHYCGATYSIPEECPECKSSELDIVGYGTERIEEEVSTLFPQSTVLRMDLDTTRSKHGYERIINNFADNKANILIGTQMVSKGLDFENVSVVGILNADAMLNYPDFRAHEKAFQMMTQVSGRAGRKKKQGVVVLQTSQPTHPIISFVRHNDYQALYELQADERRLFSYPPFCRLISVTLRSKEEWVVQKYSEHLVLLLKQTFSDKVFGPTKPAISRIQALYIRKILIKIDPRLRPEKVREAIEYYKNLLASDPESRSVLIHFDVDPL